MPAIFPIVTIRHGFEQRNVSPISVIDAGAGIPDDFIDRLFDKFT